MILNSIALIISRKQSRMPQAKSRTNVHYLVFHLTLADSIICFITLPMETLWRLTIEWYAGNILCKVLMMIRTGGYILSSCILVVISIDRSVRYTTISQFYLASNLIEEKGYIHLPHFHIRESGSNEIKF